MFSKEMSVPNNIYPYYMISNSEIQTQVNFINAIF